MIEGSCRCYLCGAGITDVNKSSEHIILNAIGGKLRSSSLLCKKCNSDIGNKADARLAEDLALYTDMLRVKKHRNNRHILIMTDKDGKEYAVENGGDKYALRRPVFSKSTDGDSTVIKLQARSIEEAEGILRRWVKDGTLTRQQFEDIVKKAKVKYHRPVLHKTVGISHEAFPSILKSAVNFFVYTKRNIDVIAHLRPYIKEEADSYDVIRLFPFKDLPFSTNENHVVHMIHIEGSRKTGMLYAMMEYFSIYEYIVILDDNYIGEDINVTYAYDVLSENIVDRAFSCEIRMSDFIDFKNMSHDDYLQYLASAQQRAKRVMNIWERIQDKEAIYDIIEDVFSKHTEDTLITNDMITEVCDRINEYFESRILRSVFGK